MTKKRKQRKKINPGLVATYRDRPLRWKDLVTLFLPGSVAPLLPLMIGYWRENYALDHYGPVAAQAWSLPWYRLSIIAMIPLVWLALRRVRRSHQVIKVFKKGIIIQSTGKRHWKFLWSQLGGISSSVINYRFLGIPMGNKHLVKVHPVEGKPIPLNSNIQGLDELCARVKAKIYPRLLRKYRLEFPEGKTLTFGPIALNNQQITINQSTIPWQQINRLDPAGGFLRLEYKENRSKKIAIQDIPNVEIMLQIIQEGVIYN